MSALKATPGPWLAPPYSSVVGLGVVGGRGTVICTIATPPGSHPNTAESTREIAAWDEIRANARLIAAAPELYEALAIFANARVDALTGTIVLGNVGAPAAVKIAQRALAKARGDAPTASQ